MKEIVILTSIFNLPSELWSNSVKRFDVKYTTCRSSFVNYKQAWIQDSVVQDQDQDPESLTGKTKTKTQMLKTKTKTKTLARWCSGGSVV